MRGKTLLMILKMLWLKIIHPKATVYINLTNVNAMKDVESYGWWIDHPMFVEYKYGSICIENNYSDL